MTDATLGSVIDRLAPDVLTALDLEMQVPIVDFARQGDVIVVPERLRLARTARTRVGPEGVAVVRGEFGGNTHLLVAEGEVFYDSVPATAERPEVGVLRVGDDSVAYLLHPEHGGVGLLPGRYTVSRQREWDGHLRLVHD